MHKMRTGRIAFFKRPVIAMSTLKKLARDRLYCETTGAEPMQFLKKWIAIALPPEINFRMNDQNRLVKQAGPAQGYRRMARISVGDRAFLSRRVNRSRLIART
jgi:hypothetical protein